VTFSLQPAVTFYIGDIPITSTILAAYIASAVLVVFAVLATRRMTLVPGGLQNFAEFAIESLLSLCEQVAGARGRAFLPLMATLFLFIVTAIWMGILPLFAEFDWEHHHVPWTASHEAPLRSANSDLNVTAPMAILVFVWVQATMIRTIGALGWLKHLTWGPPPVLELISELARPVSLALRLFGNILAGEVLLLVMVTLAREFLFIFWVPMVFMGFELFVGIVQALIFASLALAFLALASTPHAGESHGAAH
jgi:F-type H+-transporting ATPase subunit a